MAHRFRMLVLSTALIAAVTSCEAAEPREESLSKAQIDAVLLSAAIHDPWLVEHEQVSDEESPWVVFVTERPQSLRGNACVAREVILRVARDARAINEREERDVIAFQQCASAAYADFRSIDAIGDVPLEVIALLARLLRENSACSNGDCVQRGTVTYENDDVRVAFGQLDMAELHNIYVARVGNVSFDFFSKTLGPEMLGCEFRKDASGVWNLRVYRELGPEQVYTN
jgi:hypothetical protein